MVIEQVHDSEHSIIDVIHVLAKGVIESFDLPGEDIFDYEIDAARKELAENFPDYALVFAARGKQYIKDEFLGETMHFYARGVKYFNLT